MQTLHLLEKATEAESLKREHRIQSLKHGGLHNDQLGSYASSPSAWECDESREAALVFVLWVELGVFKGR
jgi:hypothetical protein